MNLLSRRKDRTVWCDKWFFPFYYAFVPDETSWKLVVKNRLKLNPDDFPYNPPGSLAYCYTFFNTDIGICSLVTASPELDTRAIEERASAIVHECVHIFQQMTEHMGEKRIGNEMEAYTIHNIFEQVFGAYLKTRGPDVETPVNPVAG